MSVIRITGAATGIGRLTAVACARAGHTVFATMRDPEGRNADRADSLVADTHGLDLRVLELDVQSQRSADDAVRAVVEAAGRLDVVVHNAAHLVVGYTEAFTDDDIARLLDVNVLGAHRVNRAALPQLRRQRSGTLVYVGSTSTVVAPPFLGPYTASKAAFDSLAQISAYEVGVFGIDTVIVMPGPFTRGTEHFPNAGAASDDSIIAEYADLDGLVAQNESATESLFEPGADADPVEVADEIVRILALRAGERPARSVVDDTHSGVERVNEVTADVQRAFVTRLGFGDLLRGR